MASLRIVGGPTAGSQIGLEKEVTVIGRSPDCDVVVPHPALARRHAQVTRRGEWFVLDDLDSRPGTWLNHQQVLGLSPLRQGDRIRIAEFEAVFERRFP
jgi:pSer/pThr/pTyr-binding forkhead associated (FHA) protein